MTDHRDPPPGMAPEIVDHYTRAEERTRLAEGPGAIEQARTAEMMRRHLPPPPGRVLDVGGAAGVYALPLAAAGYVVHLVDPVPRHIAQALEASAGQPAQRLASARVGDARRIDESDASFDAVLMLGPLYHLTSSSDRFQALTEARRVLRPGGVLLAAAISRFASLLEGLSRGRLSDPAFAAIVEGDLRDGVHVNADGRLEWFTTAYFHRPDELREEVAAAGFAVTALVGLEGPLWLLPGAPEDDTPLAAATRQRCLDLTARVESEPSLLGMSAHLLAVGRKPTSGDTKRALGPPR